MAEKNKLDCFRVFGMIVVGDDAIAISSIAHVRLTEGCLTVYKLDGHSQQFNETETTDLLQQVEQIAAETQKAMLKQQAAAAGLVVPR